LLIIFDLDDTLIDTSGCVTPFKMRECLKKLVEEGVVIPDFEKAYQELLTINAKSIKSKEALSQFLRIKGVDPELLDKIFPEMTSPLPESFSIATTPNAKEILKLFSKTHTLALVTGGHPPFQMEKLKKAGIDSSLFSKIAIPEDSVKKPFYQGLLTEFSKDPEEVLVCGDRITMDLVPAFELGITTVHMRWGRGTIGKTEKWIHHSISSLNELKRIIKHDNS
jgi:FMN phosphatase YigB (HAD superfamily)